MKTENVLLVLPTLISLLFLPPEFVHATPVSSENVPFCRTIGLDQLKRDQTLHAAKQQADMNLGELRTVRLIYFLPKDRSPQPNIDSEVDALIRNVQQSYAEQLENHGFGRRTFRFETDATGKAVVHHVKGKFDDAYYHTDTFGKVWTETAEQFDPSRNVYLVVHDDSTATIDGYCGQGGANGPEGGAGLVPAPNSDRQRERGWSCFNVAVTAHELGHAFGLAHDHFRNATRTPSSYHTDWMVTSSCAAEWLDGHRYFNIGRTNPDTEEPTTIRMLPSLPVPPHSIRLRFEATDSDGLHQAQLHNSTGEAIDCQTTNGESATVEFVTSEVTEAPGNAVMLRVVDVYGIVTEQRYPIDLTALLTPEVVSIPDGNLAAVVWETLGLDTGDAVTQLDMLKLRHLEAPARQITDLTGLEHAVNLKGLYLGENQIRDITPLAGSTILEGLQLYGNSISDLSPVVRMNNLSWLNLDGNSVSDLSPLVGLTVLDELQLNGNSISDPSPLAGVTDLEYLNLTGNSVSDLSPLASLTHLGRLELSGNPLSDRSINTYIPFLHSRGVAVQYENLRWALNFAHFANGESITSDVVLMNVGERTIRPAIYFYGKNGNLIKAGSIVDVAGNLEVQEDGGLTIRTAMEPLGELTISTHGRGSLVSGSVKVVAEGPIGGVLRYSVPGVGVTGVGAGLPVRDALFPARRKQGGIRTAAAMHNVGEEEMEVTCRLMSGGAVLEEAKIPLKANGQTSWFIEDEFTMTDTTDFVGSVRCATPGKGVFTGLAVEVDDGNRIFTTLPVVPVGEAVAGGPGLILDFAHFANDDSITSDLVLVNVSTSAVISTISFYDLEGNLIDTESILAVTGDLEVADQGTLSFKAEIPPLGELTISTNGLGELVSGSVKVFSEGPIGGVLRYSVPGVGVTGVGAGLPVRDALFPARRKQGGIRTAAAMHNVGKEEMEVTCRLMSGGAVLEEAKIPLKANGQMSWFIEDEFTMTDTTDFVGSVRCTAPGEGVFTGLAVEVDDGNRIFTTLPVVPLEQSMSEE